MIEIQIVIVIVKVVVEMGGSNIEILMFAPRAIKTSSQGSFLLIDVRSDEKTARRAAVIVLARNADKHTGHAKRAC